MPPTSKLRFQFRCAAASGSTRTEMPRVSTVTTRATNRVKPSINNALLRLLAAIRSRKVTRAMSEIRNPNFEIRNKVQFQMTKSETNLQQTNPKSERPVSSVSDIRHFEL